MLFQMQVVPGHVNDILWQFDRPGVYTHPVHGIFGAGRGRHGGEGRRRGDLRQELIAPR